MFEKVCLGAEYKFLCLCSFGYRHDVNYLTPVVFEMSGTKGGRMSEWSVPRCRAGSNSV